MFLSIIETSERLGVCSETVRRLVWTKRLRATRVGGRVLIEQKDLDAFVQANKTEVAVR